MSILVLYFVFNQTEERINQVSHNVKHYNLYWGILALCMYHLSVLFSVIRLQILLKDYGLRLSFRENYSLYYLGMFLNLFLPGGIGGDAYKGYLIAEKNQAAVKPVVKVLIWDRFIGLAGLLFTMLVCILFMNPIYLSEEQVRVIRYAALGLLILVLPTTYLILSLFSSPAKQSLILSFANAVAVQFCQAIAAVCLLYAIGTTAPLLSYIAVFLLSSIMTIIPITFGGVGLRELSFSSSQIETVLGLDITQGITLTLSFFVVIVIASVPGIIPFFRQRKNRSAK